MKMIILVSALMFSLSSMAQTGLINAAKKNPAVAAVLKATAAEAGRDAQCSTLVIVSDGTKQAGKVGFTVNCKETVGEYQVGTTISGMFIEGIFFLLGVKVDRAG